MKKVCCLLMMLALLLSGCNLSEPEVAKYNGTLEGYEYFHTEERDLKWEEDILFLAETFLENHPRLSDKQFPVRKLIMDTESSRYKYEYEDTNSFFDETARNEFIQLINQLIPEISRLTNAEIAYELQRIVATLGDAHSVFTVGFRSFFPLQFYPVYDEMCVSLYAVKVPVGYEHLLLGKLTAINDVPIDEILERLSAYVSFENEYWMMEQMVNSSPGSLLTQMAALQQAGIAKIDATDAVFTFETENGVENVVINTFPASEYGNVQLISHPMIDKFSYNAQDSLYWYELINNDKTLYIRFSKMVDNPSYPMSSFLGEIKKITREAKDPLQLVFDFRGNTGGYPLIDDINGLIAAINQYSTNGVYVLINNGTFSAGNGVAYRLANGINNAQFV